MGFDSLIRGLVSGVADPLTKSLQATIVHHAWVGSDGFSSQHESAGTSRKALIEPMHKQVRLPNGKFVAIQAKVTILETVPPNGAAGRVEPIDPRDKIILPDGKTGPVVDVPGLTDPTTTRPYFIVFAIGE